MQALRTEDPAKIGDYAVLGRLGHGAMGRVFLARSPGGRLVAVKVVRAELADDPGFRERFRQEVASVRAVGGFWTAAVVDADPDGLWLATEYVPGPTLFAAVSAHGPLPVPVLRRLVAGLAEALRAIHGAGLVHRDLKPANVLLAADGPRVIDFGIAKALAGTGLTATGMFVGTPGFLSPEQIEGRDAMPASDVFALGAVLVYAATGAGPFGGGDAAALMYRAVHDTPELDGVPAELRGLVARCLDRTPSGRPSPGQLLSEVGTPDAAEWLPAPVRAMVTEQETELGRPVARVPTRPYTKAGAPLPFGGRGTRAEQSGDPGAAPGGNAEVPGGNAAFGGGNVAAPGGNAVPGGNVPPGGGNAGAVGHRSAEASGQGNAAAPDGGNMAPGGHAGAFGHGSAEAPGQGNVAAPGSGSAALGGGNAVPGGVSGLAPGHGNAAGQGYAAPGGASAAGPAGAGANPAAPAPGTEAPAGAAPAGSRAVFRVSRLSALVIGALTTVGAIVCLSISQQAGAAGDGGGALLFFVAFVLLAVPAVRMAWILLRPRRWLEVSGDGLTVGRGARTRLVPWSQLARVRVVEDGKRPWLVVWPHEPSQVDLGAKYAGGYRVFPVGHELRKAGRRRETRELRAALGWYGRAVYDPSP